MALAINKAQLQASICKDSFFEFVKLFWDTIIPEKPIWNWHISFLCDELQEIAERVFRGEPKAYDLIINIPPGTTKSTICSIMFPAWIWTRMPEARTICGSHTAPLALDLSRRSRMIVISEKYLELFPDVALADDQSAKGYYVTTKNGGRLATMVGGAVTGFHAHFILIDDPLDPKRAASPADLKSANDWMSETLPTRKVNKELTPTILIMQRLHQNDPTGFLLGRRGDGIKHINLPAERSPKVRPVSLRSRYVDGLLDPVRLSRKVLTEARTDLGEYGYSGQYSQDPVPKGGGMFKVGRITIDTPPPLSSPQWVGLCRFWDKAGTQGGGAFTVGLLMGRWRPAGSPRDGAEDQWWVLDVVRQQLDSGAREKLIKTITTLDGRRVLVGIEQEPGSGGKESAQATAKRLAGFRVRVIPAIGSKEERADEWSSMVNAEAFKLRRADWNQAFIDELTYFPFSTYKDQVDAGAGAYTLLARPERKAGPLF